MRAGSYACDLKQPDDQQHCRNNAYDDYNDPLDAGVNRHQYQDDAYGDQQYQRDYE
jgi:hypothetical protein